MNRPDRIDRHKLISEELYIQKVQDYFHDIPDPDYIRYHRFYPIGLDGELLVMENWLLDNTQVSKRKKLLRSFICNWLRRSYIDQLS